MKKNTHYTRPELLKLKRSYQESIQLLSSNPYASIKLDTESITLPTLLYPLVYSSDLSFEANRFSQIDFLKACIISTHPEYAQFGRQKIMLLFGLKRKQPGGKNANCWFQWLREPQEKTYQTLLAQALLIIHPQKKLSLLQFFNTSSKTSTNSFIRNQIIEILNCDDKAIAEYLAGDLTGIPQNPICINRDDVKNHRIINPVSTNENNSDFQTFPDKKTAIKQYSDGNKKHKRTRVFQNSEELGSGKRQKQSLKQESLDFEEKQYMLKMNSYASFATSLETLFSQIRYTSLLMNSILLSMSQMPIVTVCPPLSLAEIGGQPRTSLPPIVNNMISPETHFTTQPPDTSVGPHPLCPEKESQAIVDNFEPISPQALQLSPLLSPTPPIITPVSPLPVSPHEPFEEDFLTIESNFSFANSKFHLLNRQNSESDKSKEASESTINPFCGISTTSACL
jgi:hypothetical protein